MGWYIETVAPTNKVQFLVDNHQAKVITLDEARTAMEDRTKGVVCIKYNSLFEAAGFCFSDHEFEAFAGPDSRRSTWLVMDRAKVIELTKYPHE